MTEGTKKGAAAANGNESQQRRNGRMAARRPGAEADEVRRACLLAGELAVVSLESLRRPGARQAGTGAAGRAVWLALDTAARHVLGKGTKRCEKSEELREAAAERIAACEPALREEGGSAAVRVVKWAGVPGRAAAEIARRMRRAGASEPERKAGEGNVRAQPGTGGTATEPGSASEGTGAGSRSAGADGGAA